MFGRLLCRLGRHVPREAVRLVPLAWQRWERFMICARCGREL